MMKPGLQLRVSQNLTLTPQLQQAIRLLLLSSVELQHEIQEMMESNPFLEESETPSNEKETAQANNTPEEKENYSESQAVTELSEMNWEQSNSTDSNLTADDEWHVTGSSDTEDWGNINSPAGNHQHGDTDEESDIFDRYAQGISLAEHLQQQAAALYSSTEDSAALMILINSLNENGYLEDTLESIADQLLYHRQNDLDYELQHEDLLERLSHSLLLLQTMDPPGIGARNLGECLHIQLKQHPASEIQKLAITLCTKHLDLLARRDYKKLATLTRSSEEDVRQAFQLILSLDPKPGRQYVTESDPVIIPDVIVQKVKSKWLATLNPETMPNIRVNDIYANALRSHKGHEGMQALGQRLQEARWFIKNIQQRFDTILRVSQAIIDRQKNFFSHGEMAMKPLVLREIADELEMHESTVSRVTTAKYMQTPFGIYELKFFFTSGLATEAGGNASSTAVRALIKKLIAEEDTKKPLSDSAISKLLEEQGIQVARRTIAKYRDELKIPTATLRKAI